MTECVLCDWTWAGGGTNDPPMFVFPKGGKLPLKWVDTLEPSPVYLTDNVGETAPYIALVAHWAREHPDQLRRVVGDYETDLTMRWASP
jgi:hypothetical protein